MSSSVIAAGFETLGRAYRAHAVRFVVASVILDAIARLILTPFGAPLNLDAFGYLLKAREITHGAWTPVLTHAIGWPLALTPAVAAAAHLGLDRWLAIPRLVAIAFSAATLVPLWAVARRTLNDQTAATGMILSVCALQSISVAVRGMSEPLHTFLLLGAVATALDAPRRPRLALACGAFAGLASWVHPTGPLVALVAVAAIAVSDGHRARAAALALAAFLIVAAPAAWQRAAAFGGPFAYGENTRIFADSPAEMWSSHRAIPSPFDFAATHSPAETARWLFVDGLAAELSDFAMKSLTIPAVPFVIWGLWIAAKDRAARPLGVALVVFLAGWVVPYPVLGASRHFAPILPIGLLLAALGLSALTNRGPKAAFASIVLIVTLVIGQLAAAAVQRQRLLHDESQAGQEWGRWIAANIHGKVAVREGQELIMMNLPDATIGGVDINTMYAPRTGLSLIKPGLFDSLDAALGWMRRQGVTHLVVDDLSEVPPYLETLRNTPQLAPMSQVYATSPHAGWPVRIYAFHWQ